MTQKEEESNLPHPASSVRDEGAEDIPPSPGAGAPDPPPGEEADGTPVLLLVTAGTRDEAERLGEALVESRIAACGSVIPMVHSFFRWEGRLHREHEALLLVKTSSARVAEATRYLLEHHSYEVPEILEFAITGGSTAYLRWLLGEVAEVASE